MRIIQTTDGKYIGMVVKEIAKEIVFPDGFVFEINYRRVQDDVVMLSSFNYIVKLKTDGYCTSVAAKEEALEMPFRDGFYIKTTAVKLAEKVKPTPIKPVAEPVKE